MVERRFTIVRKQLDNLGYLQPLAIDSLPLVEHLVSDLLHTTESLRHYKHLAQQSVEERLHFELGAEPYIQDNAKLVQECNDLHINLLKFKEESDKAQKDLKLRVRHLESINSDLKFLNTQHIAKIESLEVESTEKTRKLIQLQNKNSQVVITTSGTRKKTFPAVQRPTLEVDGPLKANKPWHERYWNVSAQAKDPYVANLVDKADKQISSLTRELKFFKEENVELSEMIGSLKLQVNNRDKEITRLTSLLEGGRPMAAVCKDGCTKAGVVSEKLKRANDKLLHQLEESKIQQEAALQKQHEAMTKAIRLGRRVKQLENELKDIDKVALAVEADCNSTIQQNSERVVRIQEQLTSSLMHTDNLEREVLELKRSNQEHVAGTEALRREKQKLQKSLEGSLEEKRKMNDHVNQLTIIERDLMQEIERVNQSSSLQKQRISELESRIAQMEDRASVRNAGISDRTGTTEPRRGMQGTVERRGRGGQGTLDRDRRGMQGTLDRDKRGMQGTLDRDRRGMQGTLDWDRGGMQGILDLDKRGMQCTKDQTTFQNYVKELELKVEQCAKYHKSEPESCKDCGQKEELQRLQAERDYYYAEFSNLKHREPPNNTAELKQKLTAKEQEVKDILNERNAAVRDKMELEARLQAVMKDMSTPPSEQPNNTFKAVMKRLEKERDQARDDVERLTEERDALRERLKVATEAQIMEHSRTELQVQESESRVRQLEAERRDLLQERGQAKAALSHQTDEAGTHREQLQQLQAELGKQRILYNQVKALQEQMDRTLLETQGKLVQSERELSSTEDRVRELEVQRATSDQRLAALGEERAGMKSTLARLDKEKDALLVSVDAKTEQIAKLEKVLSARDDEVRKFEALVTDFQKKLNIAMDDSARAHEELRFSNREVENQKQLLRTAEHAKDVAHQENRRLQDDLSAMTKDCLVTRRDLELSTQEVENLKHQLQEYVAEVRRVEELLTKKEEERSEMLNHFRSLTMEATALESNNHSLETEAQEVKGELQAAREQLQDLHQQVETQATLIQGYENQIADLSRHVAGMETQVQEHSSERRRVEGDLVASRELSSRLDKQKEQLARQNEEADSLKRQLEGRLEQMRNESEALRDQLSREHAAADTLEGLLAESRQETMQHRMQSQKLQGEVQHLRETVTDVQRKLDEGKLELRRHQDQAAELSRQQADMRRQATNERYDRVRASEERGDRPPLHQVLRADFTVSIASSEEGSPRTFDLGSPRRPADVDEDFVLSSS